MVPGSISVDTDDLAGVIDPDRGTGSIGPQRVANVGKCPGIIQERDQIILSATILVLADDLPGVVDPVKVGAAGLQRVANFGEGISNRACISE